jgi:hypothetical protein
MRGCPVATLRWSVYYRLEGGKMLDLLTQNLLEYKQPPDAIAAIYCSGNSIGAPHKF